MRPEQQAEFNRELKEMIKEDVRFMFFQKGILWYETSISGFAFPVPIDDTGDGRFLPKDRAMLFMRYIRKALLALPEYAEPTE